MFPESSDFKKRELTDPGIKRLVGEYKSTLELA